MKNSTSQQTYYALSIFLITLMPLQEIIAMSIPVHMPNKDELAPLTAIWQAPHLPGKSDIRAILDSHIVTGQKMDTDLGNSASEEKSMSANNVVDIADDAEFETKFRQEQDTGIYRIIPAHEHIIANVNSLEDRVAAASHRETKRSAGIFGIIPRSNEDISEQDTRYFATNFNKRRSQPCRDLSRITLDMLKLYIQTGRLCGSRATPVRFGLGK